MLTLHTLTRLCRARDELRETPTFPLSIHDVAQTAQMLPYHFIRRFEAVFGETPHQFRTWVGESEASTREPTDAGPVRIAAFCDTCGNLIQLYQAREAA
jgi:AraC-like DNA-binding protein